MARILLVDDDSVARTELTRILRAAGHTVSSAPSAEEGLTLFRSQPFDLVLTDIIMPRQDGLHFIADLRKDFPQVPVLAMSAMPTVAQAMADARQMSQVRFVTKTIRSEIIVAAVENELKGKLVH